MNRNWWAAIIGSVLGLVALRAGQLLLRMWNGETFTLAEFVMTVTVTVLAAGVGVGILLLCRWLLTFPIKGEDRR